jgi:hypothetical protein
MKTRYRAIAIAGVAALAAAGASACATIWSFQDFGASEEDASMPPGIDAGSGDDADSTVGPSDSGTADARDARGDAGDAGATSDAADASCPMGLMVCGTQCLDTTSDSRHCGGCDAACGSDFRVCEASTCVCATGYHPCSGVCSSNGSVNSCGALCATCMVPVNGLSNACTDAGCGTCSPNYTLCNANTASAACVDFTSDPSHCGACATVCPVADGGVTGCDAGACTLSCNPGLTACPVARPVRCVDTASDIHHCGRCGNVCPTPEGGPAPTCVDGGCQ